MADGTAPASAPQQGGASSPADLLFAFSAVTSAGLGFAPEHGARACYIGMRIAERLDLPPEVTGALYYAALAKDGGCACGASQMAVFLQSDEREALLDLVESEAETELQMLRWLFRHVGRGAGPVTRTRRILHALLHAQQFERQSAAEECEVAQRFGARLGLPVASVAALTACTERWDGKGAPLGLAGEAIPLPARIINLAGYVEIGHRLSGREAAVRLVERRAGKAFDPAVAAAFLVLAGDEGFWNDLDRESLREQVRALEPVAGVPRAPDRLDRFVEVVADLADLKRPGAAGHARRVASLTHDAGERLGLSARELATLRRAALLHDAGLVTLSAHALAAGSTDAAYRGHPLALAPLLEGVPELAPACDLAALHHERLDGSGLPGGRSADRLDRSARLLAAACRYDELASGSDALDREAALAALGADSGLDRDAVEALAAVLGASLPAAPREWPAGLTDREVEVLRHAAAGHSTAAIAERLVISPHTARHHLENAYGKMGVSTRAGAVLFAVEHGLLS